MPNALLQKVRRGATNRREKAKHMRKKTYTRKKLDTCVKEPKAGAEASDTRSKKKARAVEEKPEVDVDMCGKKDAGVAEKESGTGVEASNTRKKEAEAANKRLGAGA